MYNMYSRRDEMIIIEYLVLFVKCVLYALVRFPYWVITARDCKRCKHSMISIFGNTYCGLEDTDKKDMCFNSITMKHFERRKYGR